MTKIKPNAENLVLGLLYENGNKIFGIIIQFSFSF